MKNEILSLAEGNSGTYASTGKMETNNKPDLANRIWNTGRSINNVSSNPDDYIKPWMDLIDDVVKERDAKISELENSIPKQGYYLAQHDLIHELKHKIAELEKNIAGTLNSMDIFDKAEKQWFSENQALKSELDKAVELLKSCKLDPQCDDSEELYQQIQDFLKDK